jgi:ABC-type transport system involved in multi-copper enzyme maturation permease subunit
MLFASGLVVEREPLGWAGAPAAFAEWVRNVGMVAAVAVLIWALVSLVSRRRSAGSSPPLRALFFCYSLASLVIVALYGAGIALLVLRRVYTPLVEGFLTAAGAVALFAVALPPLISLVHRLSGRRIWALALLSIKEAIRGRVLYVFAAFALVFLFLGYFVPADANQINTYTKVIFWPLSVIFVVLAALLGSFSIPRDVVKQTIHTIVTKPVERYEIVLGRFLGNGLLLTVCLFVLTAVSLLYLMRGVAPEAAEESYKARVPIEPARLTFQGTGKEERGESVGREWDYRSYIRGRTLQNAGQPRQYAVWWFRDLPAALGKRTEPVPFEFTFDIYRTTKAEVGKEGIFCNLIFADGKLPVGEVERRVRQAQRERAERLKKEAGRGATGADLGAREHRIQDELIRRYGVYEVRDVFVVDYHIGKLKVPPSLFAALQEADKDRGEAPELKVWLSVGDDRNSSQQMLGVAKRDLYLLSGELPFWQNFFKGAAGLWMLTLFVLGVALACSTYLSGVISLLCTLVLIGFALVRDFIFELGSFEMLSVRGLGGGPSEAFWRISNHLPVGSPFEQSAIASVGRAVDTAFTWLWHFLRNLVPDIYRFNLTNYVASGYDIPWVRVLLWDNFVPLLGYLLPLALLAYYLMRAREIANPS